MLKPKPNGDFPSFLEIAVNVGGFMTEMNIGLMDVTFLKKQLMQLTSHSK